MTQPYQAQTFDYNSVIKTFRTVINQITGITPHMPGSGDKSYPYIIYNITSINSEQSGRTKEHEMFRMNIMLNCYSLFAPDTLAMADDISTLLRDENYLSLLHEQGIGVVSIDNTGVTNNSFFGADNAYQCGLRISLRLFRVYSSNKYNIEHLDNLGGTING